MMLSKCHVACNIYISAGLPVYRAVLERLLADAQQQQQALHQEEASQPPAIIVHAFADTHYDRTSFHLAGSPFAITNLATTITSNVLQVLAPIKLQQKLASATEKPQLEHPTVGIVDHISVLPLGSTHDAPKLTWDEWKSYCNDINDSEGKSTIQLPDADQIQLSIPQSSIPSGWVAWTIGWNLVNQEKIPLDVLYYGHAHPTGKPLAKVRREKTNFFRASNGNSHHDSLPTKTTISPSSLGQCTIGAPPHFVENYNIRLTNKCSKSMARSLTKAVREKDGGLPFVEALTLPYGSRDRFEVACNLLNPSVTSSDEIDAKVAEFWNHHNVSPLDHLEIAYRVGTTEAQCLQVLEAYRSRDQAEQHKKDVRLRFQACFE